MKSGRSSREWSDSVDAYFACFLVFSALTAVILPSNVQAASQGEAVRATEFWVHDAEPKPNYQLTRDDDDLKQLTDKKKSSPVIWTRKSAVGWQDLTQLVLRMKLARTTFIEEACIDVAAGGYAGVSYPAFVEVFTSLDGKQFSSFGMLSSKEIPSVGQSYSERSLCISGAARARFFVVSVRPSGKYLFLDEVRAYGRSPTFEEAREKTSRDGFVALDLIEQTSMAAQIEQTLKASVTASMAGAPAQFQQLVLEQIRQGFLTKIKGANSNKLLRSDELEDLIYWSNGGTPEVLTDFFNTISVRPVDPYQAYPLYAGNDDKKPKAPLLEAIAFGDEVGIVSVLLSNKSVGTYDLAVSLAGFPSDVKTKIHEVGVVLSARSGLVADSLSPLRNNLRLRGLQNKQLIIELKAPLKAHGEFYGELVFHQKGDHSATPLTLPILLRVAPVARSEFSRVPVTNWLYTDAEVLKKDKRNRLEEWSRNNTNLLIISPRELFEVADNGELKVRDILSLKEFRPDDRKKFRYAIFVGGNDEVLLPKLGEQGCKNESFKKSIQPALANARDQLRDLGISEQDFYFYPVDEPDSEAEFYCVKEISRAAKAIAPNTKTFITIGRLDGRALDEAMPFLDAFFVLQEHLDNERARRLKSAGKEIWAYFAESGGKGADIESVYFGAAWRAFGLGARGLGFWTYADPASDGSPWNDFDGRRPDFGVTYFDETITYLWPSKRWLAWNQGVNDFKLLSGAEKQTLMKCLPDDFRRLVENNTRISERSKAFRHCLYRESSERAVQVAN